ncbi:hypothetical protein C1H71_11015 [Iodobacter fluviatilis]|uniref:Uncharacterized protein n=1 Tax=Iodobacter fluviatilis TaxID=537 RepID=A0A7G3GA43_9NEIS|nr:hypothetical protein C1H71_11015 [Iodobacter fluviatilis]
MFTKTSKRPANRFYIFCCYLDAGLASLIALITGVSFRLLAIRLRWQLPVLRGDHIRGFD